MVEFCVGGGFFCRWVFLSDSNISNPPYISPLPTCKIRISGVKPVKALPNECGVEVPVGWTVPPAYYCLVCLYEAFHATPPEGVAGWWLWFSAAAFSVCYLCFLMHYYTQGVVRLKAYFTNCALNAG